MNRHDLFKYRDNEEFIHDQIEYWEQQIETSQRLTANLDGMPKPHDKSNYHLEELIDKLTEVKERFKAKQEELIKVIDQLDQMENTKYRNILYKRYIEGKSYEKISIEMNYSYDVVCRYNGLGLNEYDKLEKQIGQKKS